MQRPRPTVPLPLFGWLTMGSVLMALLVSLQVAEDYIQDDFNLSGLSSQVRARMCLKGANGREGCSGGKAVALLPLDEQQGVA